MNTFKKINTIKTKYKLSRKSYSSRITKSSKNIDHGHKKSKFHKQKVIMVEKTKVEYLLLFNILTNYYILLVSHGLSDKERKYHLEELILQMRNNNKLISKDTHDVQIKNIVNYLDTFFNQLLILIHQSLESIKNYKTSQAGHDLLEKIVMKKCMQGKTIDYGLSFLPGTILHIADKD